MWRKLNPTNQARAMLTLLTVAALLLPARSALACSAGDEFNPVAASSVIVAGRVTGWEPLPAQQGFTPIRVRMRVERVFKGQVGSEIVFVDTASLTHNPAGASESYSWIGGSGACGAFDEDPTGQYAIFGLNQAEDGSYRSNRLQIFFLGPEPRGQGYNQAVARLASAPRAGLPATGTNAGMRGLFIVMGLLTLAVGARIRTWDASRR